MRPVMLFDSDRAPSGNSRSVARHKTQTRHIPVLTREVIDALLPSPGETFIDGTFGAGGHSRLIAERLQPDGLLICIDRDPLTRIYFKQLHAAGYATRLEYVSGSYANMTRYSHAFGVSKVDGILLDLGFSSLQVDDPQRGFSFQHDGPLDMRFNPTQGKPASELINELTEQELRQIIYRYGDERQANRIARAIVQRRSQSPIVSTSDLAQIVEKAKGGRRGRKTHPATRTFQAFRIEVNNELGELEAGLQAAEQLLTPSGRLVVITFHSLEDRIVKQFIAAGVKGCVCPPEQPVCTCGRKPTLRRVNRIVTPTASEIAANPRARSAKIRVAERLP